ncbi:ATP-dependent RNA helicase dbp10, partial [Elasticomyces elasticus]
MDMQGTGRQISYQRRLPLAWLAPREISHLQRLVLLSNGWLRVHVLVDSTTKRFNPSEMLPRASSPAQSENDYDISAALFRKDGDQDGFDEQTPARADAILQSQGERGALSESDDDEAFIAAQLAAVNRKTATGKGPGGKKGGAFQAMGLNPVLLKAITRKGFAVPTPIQRKTIPIILDGQDVVGMARTGSGKTAAFVVPMIEKLKAHSAKVGARAVVLSPSRELALQTLKVVKELGR